MPSTLYLIIASIVTIPVAYSITHKATKRSNKLRNVKVEIYKKGRRVA